MGLSFFRQFNAQLDYGSEQLQVDIRGESCLLVTSMTQGEGEGPELPEVQTRRELLNQEWRGRYTAEGLRGGVTTPKSI
ncbi:MAG: hypothetical protein GY696_39810 [Gammaproteobacteria bacterium]|nr:hypothetical protein [Gammaproteobacteria bacterium]